MAGLRITRLLLTANLPDTRAIQKWRWNLTPDVQVKQVAVPPHRDPGSCLFVFDVALIDINNCTVCVASDFAYAGDVPGNVLGIEFHVHGFPLVAGTMDSLAGVGIKPPLAA